MFFLSPIVPQSTNRNGGGGIPPLEYKSKLIEIRLMKRHSTNTVFQDHFFLACSLFLKKKRPSRLC